MNCKNCEYKHQNNKEACEGCDYFGKSEKRFTRWQLRKVVDGVINAYSEAHDTEYGDRLINRWDSVDMGAWADSHKSLKRLQYNGRGSSVEDKARAVISCIAAGLAMQLM